MRERRLLAEAISGISAGKNCVCLKIAFILLVKEIVVIRQREYPASLRFVSKIFERAALQDFL